MGSPYTFRNILREFIHQCRAEGTENLSSENFAICDVNGDGKNELIIQRNSLLMLYAEIIPVSSTYSGSSFHTVLPPNMAAMSTRGLPGSSCRNSTSRTWMAMVKKSWQ